MSLYYERPDTDNSVALQRILLHHFYLDRGMYGATGSPGDIAKWLDHHGVKAMEGE